MPRAAIPNVNCLWGAVLAGTLARLGLRHAVISPGSRSTPLVWGLARQKDLRCIPVLDERSAAFHALGIAKASGLPVALVCTSGTAAANYLPAIIEAHYSAVPLLVLTADRPPELRDCSAGQAIDQVKLYGHYPRWQHEVALPESSPELLRYLRQTLVHAWERALNPWRGPVHLNFPFREPLAPVRVDDFRAPAPSRLRALTGVAAEMDLLDVHNFSHAALPPAFKRARRGLIVTGHSLPLHGREGMGDFYHQLFDIAWPILTDALSPLRAAATGDRPVIAHYDLLLRNRALARKLQPDAVVQIGPPPTSKILRQWLKDLGVPTLVIDDGYANMDPLHRPAVAWRNSSASLAGLQRCVPRADRSYLRRWLAREKSAKAALALAFASLDWLFEGKAAWVLSHKLPRGTPVFVASSMPVRDAEYFWRAGGGQRLFFNRGANGIDGTASTALGLAHALRAPTVLYCGDLALLHDQNGLLAARELPPGASLTIVCINNNGGGIFEHLPIAGFDPPFERFFATPQDADFGKFAAFHRLDYRRPATWEEFERALAPLPRAGVRLIELRTDRKRDAAFRKKLFRDTATALRI